MPYLIPAEPHNRLEEIKRSRFITYLAHTPNVELAKAFVNEIKAKHADARHNCWAFVAGAPENSLLYGSSDDGEPSGTAGRPMLAQLSGSGVGEICAVVTRYSGGIKLGTGGLVKAYGGGVKQALAELQTLPKIEVKTFTHSVPFELINVYEHQVALAKGVISQRQYQNTLIASAEIPNSEVVEFCRQIHEKSKGSIKQIVDNQ